MLTDLPAMTGYDAIRRSAVLAAVPRSLLLLEGGEAFDFLHRMSTNDFRIIGDGESRRTVIVNEKGRVVDLVTVTRSGTRAIVVGSAGAAERLSAWFERFIITDDVRVSMNVELPAVPALFGPGAHEFTGMDPVRGIVVREDLGRIPGYLMLPAGILTGSTEVETTAGIAGIQAIGSAALEAVRVEEKVPAAGRELGPDVNALEAGLKSSISFSKGCYIGQEVIARLDTYKKLRTIIALFAVETAGDHAPATGLLFQEGREAGRITSPVYSPLREGWIGLGFRQIRAGNPGYLLGQGEGSPSVRCTCISDLPPGYEEYEIES